MAKKSKSSLVNQEEKIAKVAGYSMTAEEATQYGFVVTRIIKAREQRELPRDEFDGMTYEQAYLSNKRAAMSYLQPKRNDDEVRVNTGVTEKRIELVMNELLSLNLEGEIRAFDKDDNLYQDVGETITDIITRTKQIEQARDKNLTIYYELLTQPSVFVEELWIDQPGMRKQGRCERRLIQGIQMYLGDVSIPDTRWNEQPYLVKYARTGLGEAERMFKSLNPTKWEFVKPGTYTSTGAIKNGNLYRKGSLERDEVETFIYMSWPDNEVQIYVQGIPFLEVGTKYTDIFGDLDGYHITMVSLKPLGGDWAYGTCFPKSAKTLQALDNEFIRNLIRKARQALEPPMGTPTGKMYSRDIWNPGHMAQGVKRDDFQKLIDHQGITQADMAMQDLIEKKMNEFIGTSQQEPLQGKTQVTATELILAQKNAVKLLGNSVLAVTRLEERLTMLRAKNVLLNHTKPIGQEVDPISGKVQEVYARFTLEGEQGASKIIQMMNQGMNEQEKMDMFMAEEKSKKAGKPFRFKGLIVPQLKKLDLYFYASVSSKPRESTELDKAMMTEMLNQGQAITAITGRPMNADKIVEKFERTYKERDLFEKEAPQQLNQGIAEQMVKKGQAGMGMKDMMGGSQSIPSVSNIAP